MPTIRSRMCLRCERCQRENSPAFQRWAIVVGFATTGVQSKHVNEPFPKTKAASDSSVATVLWTVGNARSRLFFRGSQN